MNISAFFISRPIFAGVLSIVIFLVGLIAMPLLPVSEYPEVAPPTVVVRAFYPGASPEVIAQTVASPLEQQLNGIENGLYMSSLSTTDGVMALTLTFKLGTDLDTAQMQVQNRVSQALPKLPEEVRRLGVTTVKSSPDLTMVVHLFATDGRYDDLYVRNFASLHVKDELARLPGVGQVTLFGSGDYSMRVWLDPDKVAARGLTAGDVVRAIREQNLQVAAGSIGQSPSDAPLQLTLSINARGRLVEEREFEEIIVKTGPEGETTVLRDVARIELGGSDYSLRSLLNNQSAVAIPIFQLPGSNAIALSESVRARMAELKQGFPEGLDYSVVYDPTTFVRDSIRAVVITLFEAIGLVVLVVLIFLQTWRASIIPLVAVPVSLVGTFAVMHGLGFGINALSLFGLVLSIGIVVDDAIVVVENVERNLAAGLSPVEATRKAMREVSGPIIATALVLCAVFVPAAFISGLTGQFYKQFAITIAISTVISAFNSLTLSPALSAVLLKSHSAKKDGLTRVLDTLLGWFFRPFNRFFERSSQLYASTLTRVIRRAAVALLLYGGLLFLSWKAFERVPTGFVPTQDKQYLVAVANLPDGASLDRTEAVIRKMSAIALQHPGVDNSIGFPGLSISGFSNSSKEGIVFVGLKPFSERTTPELGGPAIAEQLQQQFAGIQDAQIGIFPPPPVSGLGTIGGFKLQVEDRGSAGNQELARVTQELLAKANQLPELAFAFSGFGVNAPQLYADVDRVKAKMQGVPLDGLFETLQVYLGSIYVNDFNRFGRTYQVVAQADAPFRDDPSDITRLETRNERGEMVSLAALVSVRETSGPDRVPRYNGYTSADINGITRPGVSTVQAEAAMARIAEETLPPGMEYEWTDLTYQRIVAGNSAIFVFPLSILLVFLVLAAQYESFRLPLAILLIVPLTLLSAMVGVILVHGDNNIFTQIGLIVLLGLAAKNAILIVEFAKHKQDEGLSPVEAALAAARLRLRPILMTSIAFIAGVWPLVTSTGAGSEMRRAMGVAVFSGMIGVTIFGLLLTPVFYVVLMRLGLRRDATAAQPKPPSPAPATVVGLPLSTGGAGLVLCLLVWSSGCAGTRAGADYERPQLAAPAAFRDPPARSEATDESAPGQRTKELDWESLQGRWWELFGDQLLNALVERATADNPDLEAVAARVRQARALAQLSESELGLQGSFNPSLIRDGYSPNQVPSFGDVTANTFRAPLDLSYELDLWGGIERSIESAQASAQASAAEYHGALLALRAQVVQAWWSLRSSDEELVLLREALSWRRQELSLIEARRRSGAATELDSSRAQTELALSEAELWALERLRSAQQSGLAVLCGLAAPEFAIEDTSQRPSLGLQALPLPPAGLPADLLERRPDLAQQERRLAAASARIGLAQAAFLPRITLTGSGGLVSADLDTLLRSESSFWSIGPRVSLPIFDGGRNQAGLEAARASYDEQLALYRQRALVAFGEVQDSLDALHWLAQQADAIERARDAAQRSTELARQRNAGGVTSFFEVIDAERNRLATAREAVRLGAQRRIALVQLIRSLGGGWQVESIALNVSP